jgi:sigma-B regulation protein RsbU (phosphoserine phosphatase)
MLPWQSRLNHIVETMREMSRQTDPQEMVKDYGRRMRTLRKIERWVALSRRDLAPPHYRITRSSQWTEEIDPWRQKERLPLLNGGLLGELLYAGEPRVIDDLRCTPDDPAAAYLAGQRSLMAIPHYDNGEVINMFVMMSPQPAAFDPEVLPEEVWMSNLFGRATHNLALSQELKAAYKLVDQELKMVASVQRSLLPTELPEIPGMELAANYQTSRRAGGDYYDVFPLPGGRWGLLVADVSGHGAGAAVLMAITHSIVHSSPGPVTPAGKMLEFVNRKLADRYTSDLGSFVTAFYGIYDPATARLTYASAGHPPPRLKRCGQQRVVPVSCEPGLPLGINLDEPYGDAAIELMPGDNVLFYTDGITEAMDHAGQMYGTPRLDRCLEGCQPAGDLIHHVLDDVERFTAGRPPDDDRTLVVARIL